MAEVYLFMADGTEEAEALITADLLRRAEIDLALVSINDEPVIESSHGVRIQTDTTFAAGDFKDGKMLIFPGGMPGMTNLRDHSGLQNLLDQYRAGGKKLAAVCASPAILGAKGFLDGQRATCYPGFEKELGKAEYTAAPVEVLEDQGIITGKALGATIPFALNIISMLRDKACADRIAAEICYAGDY